MQSKFDQLVRDLCEEADNLKAELAESKWRERALQEQADEALRESLQHSQAMAGNMLKVLLTSGVTEAFTANSKSESET